jgi:hypothetical protein
MPRKSNTLQINLIDTQGKVDVITGYVKPKMDHIKWSIEDFKNDGLLVTFALWLDRAYTIPAKLLLDQNSNPTNTVQMGAHLEVVSPLDPNYDTTKTPVHVQVTVSFTKDGLDHHYEVRKRNLEMLAQKLRELGSGLVAFDDPNDPQIIIQP